MICLACLSDYVITNEDRTSRDYDICFHYYQDSVKCNRKTLFPSFLSSEPLPRRCMVGLRYTIPTLYQHACVLLVWEDPPWRLNLRSTTIKSPNHRVCKTDLQFSVCHPKLSFNLLVPFLMSWPWNSKVYLLYEIGHCIVQTYECMWVCLFIVCVYEGMCTDRFDLLCDICHLEGSYNWVWTAKSLQLVCVCLCACSYQCVRLCNLILEHR